MCQARRTARSAFNKSINIVYNGKRPTSNGIMFKWFRMSYLSSTKHIEHLLIHSRRLAAWGQSRLDLHKHRSHMHSDCISKKTLLEPCDGHALAMANIGQDMAMAWHGLGLAWPWPGQWSVGLRDSEWTPGSGRAARGL